MYFRCAACAAATWIDRTEPVGAADNLECGRCGRLHPVRPAADLGTTLAQHYRATLELANRQQIDMPCAYSVLLGVVSSEQARQTPRVRPTPEVNTSALLEYDPAFQPAIDSGHLSREQALSRGERQAFVENLVRRHRLPLELAQQVSDNRLGLLDARHRAEQARQTTRLARHGLPRDHVALVVLVAVAAVGSVSAAIWTRHFRPPVERAAAVPIAARDATSPPIEPRTGGTAGADVAARLAVTQVRRNESGRAIEILGPDAVTVLVAYCQADAAPARLEPLEIAETVPRFGNARHGVFRDPFRPLERRAIWMREDHRTRRWVAGDGKNPIPDVAAPVLPDGAFRRPVGAGAGAQTPLDVAEVAADPVNSD